MSKNEKEEITTDSESSSEEIEKNEGIEQKCVKELLRRLEKNFDKEDYSPLYTQLNNLRTYRFGKARNFDADEAWALLEADVRWRKEKKVDQLYKDWPSFKNSPALLNYWPSNIGKKKVTTDKRGFPVYFERIGFADPKSLMKAVSEDELVDFHIYIMEESEKKYYQAAESNPEHDKQGVIFVEDCSNLGWAHFHTPAFNLLKILFAIDEAHYPAGLKVLYIINTPTIFSVFYKVLLPFLDPVTASKMQILGSDYLQVLQKDIDLDKIPIEIGGKWANEEEKGCIFHGGVFGEATFDNPLNVKEIVVSARDKYEEKIEIKEKRSVICWEFKTKDYNIGFGLHFEGKEESTFLKSIEKVESQTLIQDQHIAQNVGTYTLIWDNSFSLLRSKNLTYSVMVQEPVEVAPERSHKKKKKNKKRAHSSKKHSKKRH